MAEQKYTDCGMELYTNTELIVREDILAKARELADLISTSNEVQFFSKKRRSKLRTTITFKR